LHILADVHRGIDLDFDHALSLRGEVRNECRVVDFLQRRTTSMDYENLLKQIDAEIELLKKARQFLSEPASPKRSTSKITKRGAKKKRAPHRSVAGNTLSTRSKKGRTSGRVIARKRGGDGGSGGGTGDGGYGIVR
jgi:IS5 family transposase